MLLFIRLLAVFDSIYGDHPVLQRKKHSMIAHAQPISIAFPLKLFYIAPKIIAHCLNTLADLAADIFVKSTQLPSRPVTDVEFVLHGE